MALRARKLPGAFEKRPLGLSAPEPEVALLVMLVSVPHQARLQKNVFFGRICNFFKEHNLKEGA